MPDPKKYKNQKDYMKDCMHENLHVEKKSPEQSTAICLNRWRHKKTADYPDHPQDIVISKNKDTARDIHEIDVWNYYSGIKNKLLPELKNKDLFIGVKTEKSEGPRNKPVYIRHPYDKKTEFIRINSTKDFEKYHSGRTVEYHTTMPAICPYYIVDFDAVEDWGKTKDITADIADNLSKNSDVKSVEIRYTGKRGFHIIGHLKKTVPVDKARETLKDWLKETFGDRDDLVIGESPKGSKGALGVSPMKLNGGHIAKGSLRVTGLCCVEVPRSKLNTFKREDASMDKVYKKLSGKDFKWGQERAQKIIKAFVCNSGLTDDPMPLRRQPLPQKKKVIIDPKVTPQKVHQFAKPGDPIEVYENGKWVMKPWSPKIKDPIRINEMALKAVKSYLKRL